MTTVSCCTRGTNGPSRRDSTRIGFATILRSSWTAPLNRSTWPTCRTTFRSRAMRKSSRASSSVEVSGFSTRTLMPASRQSFAISK